MITYSLTDNVITPKYKGTKTSMENIVDNDLQYVVWCLENSVFELDDEAYSYYKEEAERQGVDV